MLDQDVLQNSHEAGVGGLESEILNGFVSFIKSIYECQGNGLVPTMVVGVGVGSCEVLIKYFRGKINSVECLEKLGEENTKFLSSIAMGALVN
ncbi:hypothetical protein VN1215_00450 [Helicobacter pylori]|nr:hypothetical protein VN1215_00450 [Helicobacter pylori]